jgi:hypothetical protein
VRAYAVDGKRNFILNSAYNIRYVRENRADAALLEVANARGTCGECDKWYDGVKMTDGRLKGTCKEWTVGSSAVGSYSCGPHYAMTFEDGFCHCFERRQS